MPQRVPIPAALRAAPFTVSTALATGVTKDRLRSNDLHAPFHGVRVVGPEPDQLGARCRAYSARMQADHAIGHTTAAHLMGIPLPNYARTTTIHVSAPFPRRAPTGRGIVGHQNMFGPADIAQIHGIPVLSPAMTWCSLATALDLPDLVAAGDFLVTGAPFDNIPPLLGIADLEAATRIRQGERGQRARVSALALVRTGALSRPESLVRLLLRKAGLPEHDINADIIDARGTFLSMPDLSWPKFRVAVEYEGDHHREKDQFRKDIRRIERLIDHGWIVMRVSADDLFDRQRELVERVARRLESRGWGQTTRDLRQIGHFRR